VSKVVALNGGPTGEKAPNENCIANLKAALERAEAGEVVGCIVIQLHHDNLASCSFGGVLGGYAIVDAAQTAMLVAQMASET
jgi:hypothetical protein